jgi:glucan phosphoethanolaminetransferase (alkaline phosphatase superfamily)
MITVIGLWFMGAYLSLSETRREEPLRRPVLLPAGLIVILLLVSVLLSIALFGVRDTLAYVSQQKQGVRIWEEGGSWNLHVPSSILLFFFIPVYVILAKILFGSRMKPNVGGLVLTSIGIVLFVFFSLSFNTDFAARLLSMHMDPRYLAHSVREILTFPLTYFPIPLYFILKNEAKGAKAGKNRLPGFLIAILVFFFAVFAAGLLYQSLTVLSEGVGDLAQKPDFAKGGRLSIPYLLASHYFEHVLDSIYFTLLCLLLHGVALKKAERFGSTP